MIQMTKGRPKKEEDIKTLDFTTYQQDITLFRNGLIDFLQDDEIENPTGKETIKKFLELEMWRQNLYIVYILNKSSKFTFRALAELLQVDRNELRRALTDIKTELDVL